MTTADAHWLAAMPDVLARLESIRHPRVADVGCGQGFFTLAVASAFLDAHVDGVDTDAGAIADARARAADAGLDGRVRFFCGDASGLATYGPYDLVFILAALHDPVGAVLAARAALAHGGTVLVADERGAVRDLATHAGYARAAVLPVDHDVFHLFRLDS
jgi:SAM-dependent methyltransferase